MLIKKIILVLNFKSSLNGYGLLNRFTLDQFFKAFKVVKLNFCQTKTTIKEYHSRIDYNSADKLCINAVQSILPEEEPKRRTIAFFSGIIYNRWPK